MMKLKHDLLTSKYTEVFHEDPEDMEYNAPHNFEVIVSGKPAVVFADIHFNGYLST